MVLILNAVKRTIEVFSDKFISRERLIIDRVSHQLTANTITENIMKAKITFPIINPKT